MASVEAPQKEKYRAREIAKMLGDKANLLFFTFLSPLITELESVNKAFQTSHTDIDKLFGILDLQYKSLKQRLYDPDGKMKHLFRVDYGAKFEQVAQDIDSSVVREVKERQCCQPPENSAK